MPFLSSLSNIDRDLESDEFESLLAEIEESYDDDNEDGKEMESMQIANGCHSDFINIVENVDEIASDPDELAARADDHYPSTSSTNLEVSEDAGCTNSQSDESIEETVESGIGSDAEEFESYDNEGGNDDTTIAVFESSSEDVMVDLMQEVKFDGSDAYEDESDDFDEQIDDRVDIDDLIKHANIINLSEVNSMKEDKEKEGEEDIMDYTEIDYSDVDLNENDDADSNDYEHSCFEFEDDSSSSSMDEEELLALDEGTLVRPEDDGDDIISDMDDYDLVDEHCVTPVEVSDNYEEDFDFHQSRHAAPPVNDEESSDDDNLDEYDLRLLEEASMPIKAGSIEYDSDEEFISYNESDDYEGLPDNCDANEAASEDEEEIISFDLGESAVGDDVTDAAVASLDEHWAAHHGIKSRKQQLHEEEQRKLREEQDKLYAQQVHIYQQHGNVSHGAAISRAWGTIPPPPPPEEGQSNGRAMQINIYSSQSTFIRRENSAHAGASQIPPPPKVSPDNTGTQKSQEFRSPSIQVNNSVSGRTDVQINEQMRNQQAFLSQEEQWRRQHDFRQQQQRHQPPPPTQ